MIFMAVKYPNIMNLRFTDADMTQIEEISVQFEVPRATLVRHAWREWAKAVMEKRERQTSSESGVHC